jgi:hypothetical protein
MQRLFRHSALALALSLILVFTACGGGDGDGGGGNDNPAEVLISVDFMSLNRGGVRQVLIAVLDEDGNQTQNFDEVVFEVGGADVIDVADQESGRSGLLCAGTWDEDIIECTPGAVGQATLRVCGFTNALMRLPSRLGMAPASPKATAKTLRPRLLATIPPSVAIHLATLQRQSADSTGTSPLARSES